MAEEDLLLARPRGIAVTPDGLVLILDSQDQRIVAVDATGNLATTIGKPGQGPGEFIRPLYLGVTGEGVHVFDHGHASVLNFLPDGTFVGTRFVGDKGLPLGFSLGPSGMFLTSTSAPPRGGLAFVFTYSESDPRVIGRLVTQDAELRGDFAQQIREQRAIPEFMRNYALPVASANGGVWLFLHADQLLQRYGDDGDLLQSTSVSVPEAGEIRSAFFDWYSIIGANDALLLFTLVADGIEIDGDLWLLWDTPMGHRGLVTVHDSAGEIRHRITYPPFGEQDDSKVVTRKRFAVDAEAGRLYLVASDVSELLAFDLPAGIGR